MAVFVSLRASGYGARLQPKSRSGAVMRMPHSGKVRAAQSCKSACTEDRMSRVLISILCGLERHGRINPCSVTAIASRGVAR